MLERLLELREKVSLIPYISHHSVHSSCNYFLFRKTEKLILTRFSFSLFLPKPRIAPIVKPEPTDDTDSIRLSSNNGTPALDQDSRANSMDSKSTLLQPEPVVEDSKEFKPEIDIKEDFDVEVSF